MSKRRDDKTQGAQGAEDTTNATAPLQDQEAARQAEEAVRQAAEAEVRRQAEADATRRQAEEETRRQEESARRRAEEETRLKEEEERRAQQSVRRVEVLVDNLGPNLLHKGDVTSDPAVVALLDKPHGYKLVREV